MAKKSKYPSSTKLDKDGKPEMANRPLSMIDTSEGERGYIRAASRNARRRSPTIEEGTPISGTQGAANVDYDPKAKKQYAPGYKTGGKVKAGKKCRHQSI